MKKHWQHWQQHHQNLITRMARLVGAKSKASSDIQEALSNVTDPAVRLGFNILNRWNDEACEKAMRREK